MLLAVLLTALPSFAEACFATVACVPFFGAAFDVVLAFAGRLDGAVVEEDVR